MSWGFKKGQIYNRREDIHAKYRGQQQGGIITPKDYNLVVIITGEAGGAHGYSDQMRADGVFEYFGEGQRGDMTFSAGNKAIRTHSESGKDLLLFTKTRPGLRFEGEFVYDSDRIERAPDTEGAERNAIVFELRPIDAVIERVETEQNEATIEPLEKLRERALASVKVSPVKNAATVSVFERTAAIKNYIFARAKGKCEDCGDHAPFQTAKGRPFLEAHHIRRMSDGGPDDPRYMIALCPNCHRGAHHALDAGVRNERMQGFVTLIEGDR